MSDKTMLKKVNEIKTLESQKKAIEKQTADLQDSIKINTKAFAADHPKLYQKWRAAGPEAGRYGQGGRIAAHTEDT